MSCPCLILSYFFASTEKRKSHECCAICDFFVNSRKDGYILAVLVGYQVRASFFKSASTLDTLTVANCLPQLAARQTDDILTQRLFQLYFPRTFQHISFSGYILAVFNAYQLER